MRLFLLLVRADEHHRDGAGRGGIFLALGCPRSAKAAAPAPDTATLTCEMSLPANSKPLTKAAAEMMAVPYYRSVMRVSSCPVLKAICRRILREEGQHLLFQASTLWKLQRNRGPIAMRRTPSVNVSVGVSRLNTR